MRKEAAPETKQSMSEWLKGKKVIRRKQKRAPVKHGFKSSEDFEDSKDEAKKEGN